MPQPAYVAYGIKEPSVDRGDEEDRHRTSGRDGLSRAHVRLLRAPGYRAASAARVSWRSSRCSRPRSVQRVSAWCPWTTWVVLRRGPALRVCEPHCVRAASGCGCSGASPLAPRRELRVLEAAPVAALVLLCLAIECRRRVR